MAISSRHFKAVCNFLTRCKHDPCYLPWNSKIQQAPVILINVFLAMLQRMSCCLIVVDVVPTGLETTLQSDFLVVLEGSVTCRYLHLCSPCFVTILHSAMDYLSGWMALSV